MSYEFLEDVAIADIAFRAWGKDLEQLFLTAGDATINVMIENLDSIEPIAFFKWVMYNSNNEQTNCGYL